MADGNVSDRAMEYLRVGLNEAEVRALHFIGPCESPIEELLGLVLWFEFALRYWVPVKPQYEVEIDNKRYRLDFAIIHNQPTMPTKEHCLIAIECDGHDFHERTKAQAKRDKQRDRALQLAGWHVLRFTGSEVYNDPMGCLADIRELYDKLTGQTGDE